MKMNERGFTLIEALVAIGVVAIMAALALPYYGKWTANAKYKDTARRVASILREARSKAIAENTPFKVVFTLDNSPGNTGNTFSMMRNMTAIPGSQDTFYAGIEIRRTADCGETSGTATVTLNPNGTAGSSTGMYICILDSTGQNLYRVGVDSTTTGRVVIQDWTGSEWK